MSAFVCILDRSGADLDPATVERLAEPLASYGGALSSVSRGPVAIAIRHSVDRCGGRPHGPLTDPDSGAMVAVAGRFAAAEESRSATTAAGGPAAPDCAAAALAALQRGDDGFLARLSGSFVLVAADPDRPLLSVARDHLGDLKVYYHLDPRWLIAASEPAAILRHEAVDDGLDEVAAARFLGFRFFHCERSFFSDIRELPPAHQLLVTGGDCRSRQYWRFRRLDVDGRGAGQRLQTVFRSHLKRSIASRMIGLEPAQAALSLSGGLDSTALAALAPRGVRFFSWRLGRPSRWDERRNIEAAARHLEAPIQWVEGEGLYPLCGEYVDRFVHGNSPHLNAFAALKHRLYRTAAAAGCRRIMVGDSGDALYSSSEYWLRDALSAGRAGALTGLFGTIRRAAGGERLARRALRRLLPLPGVRGALGRSPVPWLTDLARSRLPEPRLSPILPEARWRRRYDLSVGAKHTELESEERRLFASCGIGRMNPFWHWPLLEMVINLPAWWLHDNGRTKVLTREALRGLLPPSVLESRAVGQLGSFFLRGIEARRREIRATVFERPRSDWQRYVRRPWLEPYLDATGAIQFGHTILWRVISYELWHRHLGQAGWPRRS